MSTLKTFVRGQAKNAATEYHNERVTGYEKGYASFHLPFASPTDFRLGENAAYSISFNLVQVPKSGEDEVYDIVDDPENYTGELMEFIKTVEALLSNGISRDTIDEEFPVLKSI